MNRLLPLGSVVMLKDANQMIMVIGRIQKYTDDEGNEKTTDYNGVLYPFGMLNSQEQLLFNQADIEKIYFLGYQDFQEFIYQKEIHNLNKN